MTHSLTAKTGRNDPCPCGSGLKYKKCCESAAPRISPDQMQADLDQAIVAHKTKSFDEAVECYRQILSKSPTNANALHMLGVAEYQRGNHDLAIELIQKALPFMPSFAKAHLNLANAYRSASRFQEAIESLNRALSIQPAYPNAYLCLGSIYQEIMLNDKALDCYRRALELQPDYAAAHSNILMLLLYDPDQTPETILEAHKEWNRRHGSPPQPFTTYRNSKDADRILKIGYVSSDLAGHPVGYFLQPVLKAHDRNKVKVFCYSGRFQEDSFSERLRASTDVWRPVTGVDNSELARQIRNDGIDILVDLSGHTANNRLQTFALKPAPVQATWLGYPDRTGLDAIDYRLTDSIADPPVENDAPAHGREILLRLPNGFLCYEPIAAAPEVMPLPVGAKGYITFGSLNNLAKVNDRVIALWAKILKQVPGSRLILKGQALKNVMFASQLLERFIAAGADSTQIELRTFTASIEDHYRVYNDIDIALDTFPYNGTTTTFDALWMGAPVVTLNGVRHASRVGASILTHIGLADLIAASEEEYVATAVRLANDFALLEGLRQTLRKRVADSSFCNAAAFTASLEAAYREMWTRWCLNQQETTR